MVSCHLGVIFLLVLLTLHDSFSASLTFIPELDSEDPHQFDQMNLILADPPSKAELEAMQLHSSNGKTNLSEIHYYLHTNENQEVSDELFTGDQASLENSHFHRGGDLWVLVHGFGANIGGSTFPYGTGIDLLSLAPQGNVILVDWSTLAASPNYVEAVRNGYAVSNHTAEFLQFLVQEGVATPDKIHLIGYSLGGQVVGIIGKRFQWLTNQSVARVTGLDPAWPLFAEAEDDNRISPDDATFVDVLHTNAGTLGVVNPTGHMDFYPNGGANQPGCGIDLPGSCSHGRAPRFFKESIKGSTPPFTSWKCPSWDDFDSGNCMAQPGGETVDMGYHVDQSARGNFYLRTNADAPYAQG